MLPITDNQNNNPKTRNISKINTPSFPHILSLNWVYTHLLVRQLLTFTKDHFCLILFGQTFDPSVQISDVYQIKFHQLPVHYLAYDIPADINKVVKICNYKKFIQNQKALIISKLTV